MRSQRGGCLLLHLYSSSCLHSVYHDSISSHLIFHPHFTHLPSIFRSLSFLSLQLVFNGDANGSCPQGSEAEAQVLSSALALVQSQKDRLEALGVRQVKD